MENFTEFKSIYEYLEKDATNFRYPFQIGNLFQRLRDLKYKENKLDEAERAQWKIDFLNFTIKEGKLNPKFTGTNDKGEVVKYPILDRFDNRTYEYLMERLNSTSNPLLKARYSHILWCSPKKHTKYAKISVDSYLKLIKIYEAKDVKEAQEHYGLDILNIIKNAYSVACGAKYKIGKTKLEIRRLVNTFNFKSSSSFALRINLIKLMLEDKRRFFKKDFLGFKNICCQISESLMKSGNIHGALDMLEVGEKVEKKLGKITYDWRRRIAESYEILMEQAEKNNNLVSLTFCQYALENYKKLKDRTKIDSLEKKYSELKKSMKLAEFKTKIDLTEHVKWCNRTANELVKSNPEKVIKILMLDKNLLPEYKDIEKKVKDYSKKFVLQSLFSTGIIDQNGHLTQHFSDEDEKKYYSVLQQYDWEIKFNKIYLINEIFFTAIRENKLSADILLKFLNKYSWFGKDISKKIANHTIKYNWLNLIAPSLHEYFLQMQYWFANQNYLPNLVLSIDSLTLKIEGLVRDICRFSGISTFHTTKDKKGRSISKEKDIHALLHEEPIKRLFDEDDLLFFKFLLVEKAGYNLRHKIAHSLMLFQEYSIGCIHLLILALLKLGKYDFVKRKDVYPNKKRI